MRAVCFHFFSVYLLLLLFSLYLKRVWHPRTKGTIRKRLHTFRPDWGSRSTVCYICLFYSQCEPLSSATPAAGIAVVLLTFISDCSSGMSLLRFGASTLPFRPCPALLALIMCGPRQNQMHTPLTCTESSPRLTAPPLPSLSLVNCSWRHLTELLHCSTLTTAYCLLPTGC